MTVLKVITQRMAQRRDTAANWTASSADPTRLLADGEFGWEKDSRKFKVGDGVTEWNDLLYGIQGEPGPAGPTGPTGTGVGALLAATNLATSVATTITTAFTDILGTPIVIAPNIGTRTVEHEIALQTQPAAACTLIMAIFDATGAVNLGTAAETITAGGFRRIACKVPQTPGAGIRSIRPRLALLSGSTAVSVYGVDVNTIISSASTTQR